MPQDSPQATLCLVSVISPQATSYRTPQGDHPPRPQLLLSNKMNLVDIAYVPETSCGTLSKMATKSTTCPRPTYARLLPK
jgi:hypothetical protein